MNVLFFLYKSKTNSKGTAPIFCRLTLKTKRKQFSTGLYVKDQSWNSQFQKVKGTSTEAQNINNNLDIIRQKLNKAYGELLNDREYFVVDELYNRYTGTDREYKTLLQAFTYHNQKMKALIGEDYVKATYDKFVVIQSHIQDFIREQYKYPLCQIKLNFLTALDHYLKVSKDHNQNTINKVIERLKKAMKIAVGNGWLTSDPFMLYQKKKHIKEVVFLSNLELKKLENHKFAQERLALVRDCFIFSCYTGLAYNEAALLSNKHLQLDETGFNFPPHEKNYDLVFLNQFIELFNSLLNQYHIEQIHSDELLFLAYTFIIEDRQKQLEIYEENCLRSNGKLLLEFIKVPLTKHNISNIRNAFSDDGLFPDEIDEHLLAYLGVVSGQHEDTFKRLVQSKLKESPDPIWEIMDLNELDESLKTKLIRKIQIDKNISIKMPNGNLLIISKDITPKFTQKGKYKNFNFSAISRHQNKMIISSIVNSLFDEQKKREGTQFYDKLLKHDFESTNYKDLDKAVGLLTSYYHTYKLKKLHSLY